jgi:hypothetical protein
MKLCWMLAVLGLLGACEHGITLGDPKQAGGSAGSFAGAGGAGGSAGSSIGAGGAGGSAGGSTGVGGTGGGAGGSTGVGGIGGSPASIDGGDNTCRATCSTPAGTVQTTFASQSDVYSIFVGQWRICPGGDISFPGIPADAIGVEYDAPPDLSSDGNMYYLVQGSSGPVRGAGFDYQLTYNLYPEGVNSYQLDMYQNGGFGGGWRYSPCPRELQIGQTEGSGKALLVPF